MTNQKSARDVVVEAVIRTPAQVGYPFAVADNVTDDLTASGHFRDPDWLRLEGWRKMKEAALIATPDTGPYAEDVAQAAYFCGVMDYSKSIGAITPPADWTAQPDPKDATKPRMPAHDYASQWAQDTLSGNADGTPMPWGERNLARAYLDQSAEIARLRDVLADLMEVQMYATGWDNGVTDPTGTIHEAAYWHSQAMDRARAALEGRS